MNTYKTFFESRYTKIRFGHKSRLTVCFSREYLFVTAVNLANACRSKMQGAQEESHTTSYL
jgi:hypothetical protein